ncbi:MAG TPA: SCO1664 family protein [Jatrophihabitantaceae bacterium]|nr:SCO1664 family protein [Jatrophihabitantaceae bacterium]
MIPDELAQPLELPAEDAIVLLAAGELTIEGRLVDASNATFYCAVSSGTTTAACVYKPVAGERPLWDFPDGTLAEREVAAYEMSAATGWGIVPPTVYRDGPLGPGMVQLWIAEDADVDLLTLIRSRRNAQLRRIAVFDAIVNNADRKGGHLLPGPGGHIFGIDHGVTFHAEDKLRTVLWQWAGQRLPEDSIDVLRALRASLDSSLGDCLSGLLTTREVRRTARRIDRLLSAATHPEPGDDWPPVPWPPI